MSDPVYFGHVYVATALGPPDPGPGSSAVAAVSIVGVPADNAKPQGSQTRLVTRTTTNPQAVALGILWAFKLLGPGRWGTVCTNLKSAEMLRPQAIRHVALREQYPLPADEDPRSFTSLMDRVSRHVAATIRNEVAWLPKADEDRYFLRARTAALRAIQTHTPPPSTSTPR